ncbi:hypothetical protein KCU86_g9147, partial [Aureobasidium melanogenum]
MISFTIYESAEITDTMIHDIAALFSENYGIWGAAAQGRKQGQRLLAKLSTNHEDDGYGILSSHPFAVSAILRALGRGLDQVEECTISPRIRDIMASCPVNYVRTAKLRGSLFDSKVTDGTVSCADTEFFVDHAEPDAALDAIQSKGINQKDMSFSSS